MAGWSIDGIGLRGTLLCFGVTYIVLVLVSLRSRALRDMDVPSAPAEESSDTDKEMVRE